MQTHDITYALDELMLDSPLKARRIETMRAGLLTRKRSKRMSKLRSGAKAFETLPAAEAWLAA